MTAPKFFSGLHSERTSVGMCDENSAGGGRIGPRSPRKVPGKHAFLFESLCASEISASMMNCCLKTRYPFRVLAILQTGGDDLLF